MDVLGDIGGLLDALRIVAQLIIVVSFSIFGNPMHEYLLKGVFMREAKFEKSAEGSQLTTRD